MQIIGGTGDQNRILIRDQIPQTVREECISCLGIYKTWCRHIWDNFLSMIVATDLKGGVGGGGEYFEGNIALCISLLKFFQFFVMSKKRV